MPDSDTPSQSFSLSYRFTAAGRDAGRFRWPLCTWPHPLRVDSCHGCWEEEVARGPRRRGETLDVVRQSSCSVSMRAGKRDGHQRSRGLADAQARKYEGTESEVRWISKEEKRWKKKPEGKFGSKTKRPSREGKMMAVRRKAHLRLLWNQRATNPNPIRPICAALQEIHRSLPLLPQLVATNQRVR